MQAILAKMCLMNGVANEKNGAEEKKVGKQSVSKVRTFDDSTFSFSPSHIGKSSAWQFQDMFPYVSIHVSFGKIS
jgi:hypothetical protein